MKEPAVENLPTHLFQSVGPPLANSSDSAVMEILAMKSYLIHWDQDILLPLQGARRGLCVFRDHMLSRKYDRILPLHLQVLNIMASNFTPRTIDFRDGDACIKRS